MFKLDPAVQAALKNIDRTAMERIGENKDSLGITVNGWLVTKGLGSYATNYLKSAVVAAYGCPANQQDDAVYPYIEVDSLGQHLSGSNKYTLVFRQG